MAWMPVEQWNAIKRAENCQVCAELNEAGHPTGFVAALRVTRLRLNANQYVRGYCVLTSLIHAVELHHLPVVVQHDFLADLAAVSTALEDVFTPDKLNINFLGNIAPHLHCHILPRYVSDDAPHRPIDPQAKQITLKPQVFEQRIQIIRESLRKEFPGIRAD